MTSLYISLIGLAHNSLLGFFIQLSVIMILEGTFKGSRSLLFKSLLGEREVALALTKTLQQLVPSWRIQKLPEEPFNGTRGLNEDRACQLSSRVT